MVQTSFWRILNFVSIEWALSLIFIVSTCVCYFVYFQIYLFPLPPQQKKKKRKTYGDLMFSLQKMIACLLPILSEEFTLFYHTSLHGDPLVKA